LRELGARVVNIQFQYAWSIFPPYEPAEDQYALVTGALDNAEAAGLYVILGIRNGPGRNALMDSVDEGDVVTALYTDLVARQAYIDMTKDVVGRFKHREEIIAWEPLVEPAPDYYLFNREASPYPKGSSLWSQVAAELIQAVRSEDEDRPILVSPVNWGGIEGFRGLTPFPDDNIIYSLHTYDPWEYTHQFQPQGPYTAYPGRYEGQYVDGGVLDSWLAPVEEFQRMHRVPIIVGEFGGIRWLPGMQRYIGDQIANFEKRGWSWMLYAWYDAAWAERGLELQWGRRRDQLIYDPDNPVLKPVVGAWR
jgi:hypothetical protein